MLQVCILINLLTNVKWSGMQSLKSSMSDYMEFNLLD